MMDAAIEFGAEDCKQEDGFYQIITSAEDVMQVAEQIALKFGEAESVELTFIPQNTIDVDMATAEKIVRLVDVLEENDDVQRVMGNFAISDEIIAKL